VKIAISGSRNCTPAMGQYARRAVERATKRGDVHILVGDATGIDTTVQQHCHEYQVPFTVHYAATPRNLHPSAIGSERCAKKNNKRGFGLRDRSMIREASLFLGIWDGESAGTQAAYFFAQKINIEACMWSENNVHPGITVRTGRINSTRADKLDTTIKSGEGFGKQLAPTWDLVMGHKRGEVSDREYTDGYLGLLESRYAANRQMWHDWMCQARSVTLTCYCGAGKFCHRHLLANRFLPQVASDMGIPYQRLDESYGFK